MKIKIPYYKDSISADIPDWRLKAVLEPAHEGSRNTGPEETEVERALSSPVNSPLLSALASDRKNVLVITSDHTRPVPSRITMPVILRHIREGNPDAEIKILIATGFHRATTAEELADKFGEEICSEENIIVHDAFASSEMVFKGVLPSGGELHINRLVDWADLIVAEGFIEPHFFAGFSGGRKSILPGICSERTIMYNHNAQFIAHPRARTGSLDGNPLHTDMLFASEKAGLAFILNVVLDENKKITEAFAGHPVDAHLKGCGILGERARVNAVASPIAVTSNGGYPLDQNIYQTVKGMTAAESCIPEGGVIIMISSCCNGHGGEGFYNWFKDSASPGEVWEKISSIPPEESLPDQWEAQILARILKKCSRAIIVSSHADPQMIKDMHMLHAETFEQALSLADGILGSEEKITLIPDGVGVIINEGTIQ